MDDANGGTWMTATSFDSRPSDGGQPDGPEAWYPISVNEPIEDSTVTTLQRGCSNDTDLDAGDTLSAERNRSRNRLTEAVSG